ncbi:FAD-binding and (Fe-S)-binding domain-containing protein [Devosia sp. 1566]|uniref:FAD-binding and (Fe-S)-binding domain-containing protein n=1 Tax=Devosia sp. 1566 TaxID=2499144 RepID=UPI000FD97B38|nr:FAD-binding and (Fe-S)-binding domain-containing protein [Devosia sp. 1566]
MRHFLPHTATEVPSPKVAELILALRRAGFRGALDHDGASRAAMSTDNSVYQITPVLIAAPMDEADAVLLVRVTGEPQFRSIPLTARGGGTGTNGQSLNSGVVVDFRRHMYKVLAVNEAEGWADVEPGVVLDSLNSQVRQTGLFFAPETSTSNRCTIGGMVATDASGKGSRRYGKTADNVLGLTAILSDGTLVNSLRDTIPTSIATELEAAGNEGRAALLEQVPKLPRRFSGYDLDRAQRGADGFEWWRLFVGAEGTLGLVTRIRVRLVPAPPHRRLLVAGFSTFLHALEAAEALLAFEPLAVECLDEWVQRLADEAGLLTDLPPALRSKDGVRPVYDFIEFSGDDQNLLDRQVAATAAALHQLPGFTGFHLATSDAEISRLWAVRSASVGLLARGDGKRVPVSFVEDCALPPASLSAFVEAFGALMARHGLRYGIYGHADVGCLHVRPALDISDAADRALLGEISAEVLALVSRLGGIFWGEHGKGVRGQYLAEFVGPVAYEAFRRVKAALDPHERFNPGKLVTLKREPMRVSSTPFRSGANGDAYDAAFRCNGNAICHSFAASQTMCPSFKLSNEALHSPRGRAEALKLWSNTPVAERERGLDRSVHAALDACLGCKACASTCPVQIDIPEMKSHFLADWHQRHRRPVADHAAILVERFHLALALTRPLASLPPVAALMRAGAQLLGLIDIPTLSRRGHGLVHMCVDRAVAHPPQANSVLLAIDAMTSLFDTEAIADIGAGLSALGFHPIVLDLPGGGKAAHAKGDRRRFLTMARELRDALDRLERTGLPVVGIDPAFVTLLREEYRHAGLMPRQKVLSPVEFLLSLPPEKLRRAPAGASQEIFLHCMESARGQTAVKDWQQLGDRLGIAFTVAQTGCCGMAGLYGHERHNQDNTRRLFAMAWSPAIERQLASGQERVLATGFSCRCQAGRFANAKVAHPLRLIAERLQ